MFWWIVALNPEDVGAKDVMFYYYYYYVAVSQPTNSTMKPLAKLSLQTYRKWHHCWI